MQVGTATERSENVTSSIRAYGKAGNGMKRKQKMETGNGNWKRKLNKKRTNY